MEVVLTHALTVSGRTSAPAGLGSRWEGTDGRVRM